jgi:divalent metal cation (Fe/Co/Zn/Cd) transporter
LIEKQVKLIALLLGIMVLIFALSVQLPGVINAESEMAMQASMTNMLKDIALSGAAFFVSGIYANEPDEED